MGLQIKVFYGQLDGLSRGHLYPPYTNPSVGVGVRIVGTCELIGALGEVSTTTLHYKALTDVDEGDLDS